MKITFKLADEFYIKGIVDLCNECFDENTDYEDALDFFKKNRSGNQIYLIGECNGEVIAHALISIIPTMFQDMETYAILNHVCVKEEYRKHKIASKMLEVIEKICKEKKCISMKLWSKNFRVPAHKCYLRFGFQKIDAGFFEKDIRE